MLAGLVASIEHLAGLDEDVIGKRRRRLVASLDGVYEYLQRLTYYLVTTLTQLNHINVVGTEENRVPLVSFTVDGGVSADKVVLRLADNGVCALADVPNRALVRMGAPEFGGCRHGGARPPVFDTVRSRPSGPDPWFTRLNKGQRSPARYSLLRAPN